MAKKRFSVGFSENIYRDFDNNVNTTEHNNTPHYILFIHIASFECIYGILWYNVVDNGDKVGLKCHIMNE